MAKIDYGSPQKIDSYLVGIAKKLAYRCYSSRKKAIPTDKLDSIPTATNLEQTIENRIMHYRNREQLRKAIVSLPQRYQRLINAKFFAGFDDAEAAKLLQVKPASIRMTQTRALRALKKEFDRLESSGSRSEKR